MPYLVAATGNCIGTGRGRSPTVFCALSGVSSNDLGASSAGKAFKDGKGVGTAGDRGVGTAMQTTEQLTVETMPDDTVEQTLSSQGLIPDSHGHKDDVCAGPPEHVTFAILSPEPLQEPSTKHATLPPAQEQPGPPDGPDLTRPPEVVGSIGPEAVLQERSTKPSVPPAASSFCAQAATPSRPSPQPHSIGSRLDKVCIGERDDSACRETQAANHNDASVLFSRTFAAICDSADFKTIAINPTFILPLFCMFKHIAIVFNVHATQLPLHLQSRFDHFQQQIQECTWFKKYHHAIKFHIDLCEFTMQGSSISQDTDLNFTCDHDLFKYVAVHYLDDAGLSDTDLRERLDCWLDDHQQGQWPTHRRRNRRKNIK